MKELYREMMNQGFLIFEYDTKFVLDKINTPANQLPLLINTSPFNSFDEALDAVKKMIDWKEDVQLASTAPVQTSSTTWVMQMMYRHIGMGTKFVDLGELGSTSYQTALDEAHRRAESYIIQSNIEKDVLGFEVKVRPCLKQ